MKDFTGESRLLISAMVEINELPRLMLLKFPGGQSLVLPKAAMHQVHAGTTMLRSLAQRLNIPYTDETGWEWK